jgi:hypothetical protein
MAAEFRDDHTARHLERISVYSAVLAQHRPCTMWAKSPCPIISSSRTANSPPRNSP